MPHHPILLCALQWPGAHTAYLGDEEVCAAMHGYRALWHPAVLAEASEPPRIVSPFDHAPPEPDQLIALPATPVSVLPDSWFDEAQRAGTRSFTATTSWHETLANLRAVLPDNDLGQLAPEPAAPFFALGFGFAVLGALCEAMSHDNLVPVHEFWAEVQSALHALRRFDTEVERRHLQSAAVLLQTAREQLYPVAIHWIDLLVPESDDALPPSADRLNSPLNLVTWGTLLERWQSQHADAIAPLREAADRGTVEIIGGGESPDCDALLPLQSQLWDVNEGQATARRVLGREPEVYARPRLPGHSYLPALLDQAGLRRVLLLPGEGMTVPSASAMLVQWPAPSGKLVQTFLREPLSADSVQTFFHLGYHLHRTIMQDHVATLYFRGGDGLLPWHADCLELARWAPVLGTWTTLSKYGDEVGHLCETVSGFSADDFHVDLLGEPERDRVAHTLRRRKIDVARTLSGLLCALGTPVPEHDAQIADLERQAERGLTASEQSAIDTQLEALQADVAERLTRRLQARSSADQPGMLVLNPCSFARRVALESTEIGELLPCEGPLKACQVEDGLARLVVEVPALGYAWIPRRSAGSELAVSPVLLADEFHLRNEYFEAEIDSATGGLRALRAPQSRVNRLGQQLVFQPGSTMRAESVRVVSRGPALGEVRTEGTIVDERGQLLANFRQCFRAWRGRPVLELGIEIEAVEPPVGYPWYCYHGARFAWRDEQATVLRGVFGTGAVTHLNRPESPEFLEIRTGEHSTILFTLGLPFLQRRGSRMMDVLLLTPGQSSGKFELAMALDRGHAAAMAQGLLTTPVCVPTALGPQPEGISGWLFHIDAPNILLLDMRAETAAVTLLLQVCGHQAGPALLRCVRDPRRALIVNERGSIREELRVEGDAVHLDLAVGRLARIRLEF